MYKIPGQLTSARNTGVETLATIANAAFAGAERMTALNLNAARTFLEDSAANTRALVAVRGVQGFVSLQNKLAKPGLEKAAAYSRSARQIAAETREALSEVMERQVSRLDRKPGKAA